MKPHPARRTRQCVLTVVAAAALAAPAGAAAHGPRGGHDDGAVSVVATGLDNPRGLAFGPDDALYVAESGKGGDDCTFVSPEDGTITCFGTTGAITRVDPDGHGQRRVASGLPSIAGQDGSAAEGPSDVAFGWSWPGYVTIGLGGNPALRTQHPDTAGMAKLYRWSPRGGLEPVADLGAFEAANNPDAGQPSAEVDTNPNSVVVRSPWKLAVADAGGNDLLSVKRDGSISVLGVLPFSTAPAPPIPGFPVPPGTPLPLQPVPTSVVRGPNHAYYVGQLTGFPFPTGAASVWRIRRGAAPEQYASGFTQITDLAFGRDGSLYVLEIATGSLAGPPSPGALIRVAPDGTRTELAPGTLTQATGLVLGRNAAYVSDHGSSAGAGRVVRIPLPRSGRHH